jgi:hypothetical protein
VNSPPPSGWMSLATRAAWTLLLVALVACVVWSLLVPLLPALVVLLVLVGIYRLAIGWFRRDSW